MRAFFVVTLIGGAALGAAMQGSFLMFLLLIFGVEYLLFPSAVILIVVAVIQRLRGHLNTQLLKSGVLAWCAIAGGLFFMWGTGRVTNRCEVDSVHLYVAKSVPLLEQIKARDGSYPSALPVSQLGEPPILLQTNDAYRSDGKEFHFQYSNPAEFLGGEQFDSSTRQWSYFDPMG